MIGAHKDPSSTSLADDDKSTGDVTDVEKQSAMPSAFASTGQRVASSGAIPARSATFRLPNPATFGIDESGRRTIGGGYSQDIQRERTLEATQSIGGLSLARATARQNIDPRARVAADFRTMSIQMSQGGVAAPATPNKKSSKFAWIPALPFVSKKSQHIAVADQAITDLEWHLISIDEVFQRLSSSPKLGLEAAQIERKRAQDGLNKLSKPPSQWPRKIFNYWFGGFGSLLLVAAILVMISWKPLGAADPQVSVLALSIVLFAVLALQALFNAWQDFTTSRTMASISGMLPSSVLVIRGGERTSIPPEEVVRGDIVVIGIGQRIAADVRFFHLDSQVKIDRSMLTGESDAIKASVDSTDNNYLETRNMAFMGTMCVSGSGGLAVVTAIGDDTVFGRLAKDASKPRVGKTTLEKEIFYFVFTISTIAISLAVICIIVWAAYLRPQHPEFMSVPQLIVNVVSIVVAFIPEGLPIAVTLSLTAIASRMRKARVLAKTLSVVETLGAVNCILSDKTGTLTTNEMRVTSLAVFGHNDTCSPTDSLKHITLSAPLGHALRSLAWLAGVCNAASFQVSEDKKIAALSIADRPINGDATDSACLRLCEELGGVDEAKTGWNIIGSLAFNSKNKFAVRILQLSEDSAARLNIALCESESLDFSRTDHAVLIVKGAPDILLKRCASILDAGGKILPLDSERLAWISRVQSEWADQGQRVLVLARKVISREGLPSIIDDDVILGLTEDLTVVGLVGIVDPPRPEIPGVVATCRGAGARFFMVTGDFQKTAVAIARQCGIISARTVYQFKDLSDETLVLPEYHFLNDNASRPQLALSLSGADLEQMNAEQWERACRFDEIVFARTTPEQKLRIVTEFQARDGIVSMTGDGANDAPALRQADVGVAIAGGSDIAVESADLVLLDGFSGFVDALMLGRLCFDNLKKTVAYLLPAGTFAELWAVLVAFFFGLPQAISNLQMIFICVCTDMAPSLSLINESPESDILKRKPRNVRTDRLADWKLLCQSYLFLGLPLTVFAMTMAFWFMQRSGLPFSSLWLNYGGAPLATQDLERYNEILYGGQSVYFFTLVLSQWGTLLIVRTRKLSIFQQPPYFKPSTANWFILPAMITALALAIFFSYIPGLQKVLNTRGVPAENYGLPLAYALFMLCVDETRKYLVRKYPKSFLAKAAW
ncbi:calcium ATPase [Microstroma glucosiphilum]|uniref:Calcium ATPase n=1 Tax=Pseudomicrostroma glucosiphilum TaxID=1684307 RepID=A0A316U0H4_9BASI|nr:calcium ATPase [Pseudomicrostroma glucosiphilum]PWN18031.1 calcium ATPase [Pseudomicrostroma glucosiphilum]